MDGRNAFKALAADVCPVPPFVIATVAEELILPDESVVTTPAVVKEGTTNPFFTLKSLLDINYPLK